jgi:hypothetical protein
MDVSPSITAAARSQAPLSAEGGRPGESMKITHAERTALDHFDAVRGLVRFYRAVDRRLERAQGAMPIK